MALSTRLAAAKKGVRRIKRMPRQAALEET